jgi:hypothetical protein
MVAVRLLFALVAFMVLASGLFGAQPPEAPGEHPVAADPPATPGNDDEPGIQTEASEQDAKDPQSEPAPRRSDAIEDIAPETATHTEVEPLPVEFGELTAFRLRGDGSLLACDAKSKEIKIIHANGDHCGSMPLDFSPEALGLGQDGLIYCGGEGQLAVLDSEGAVVHAGQTPDDAETPLAQRRRGRARPVRVSGIAVSQRDVFVAFGSGWSTGSKSKLYRLDLQLENPLLLMEGLRGCCQRCDILFRDGVLYLAENSAHRVVLCDRTGAVLNKWGERQRDGLAGFSACCNPMNIDFDQDGILYTSESGLGRVKRYTKDGQFVDLAGYVGTERFQRGSGLAASCSNMALAVTPDASRIYVMDYREGRIRVMQRKGLTDAAMEP